jgi:ATP synthase protein I
MDGLLDTVGRKEARKLRSRRIGRPSIAFGLGLFGVVGWSVALPTLLGIALGAYLDRAAPARFSWTLTLMVVGLALGALAAWSWLRRSGWGPENDRAEPEDEQKEA